MECSEVAINVFVNLDPILMVVFRSVCKSWYDISKSTTPASDVLPNYRPIPIRSYPLYVVARVLPSSECYDIMLRNQLYDHRLVRTYLSLDGIKKWSYTPSLMKIIIRSNNTALVRKVLGTMQLTIRYYNSNIRNTTEEESKEWSNYFNDKDTALRVLMKEPVMSEEMDKVTSSGFNGCTLYGRDTDEVLLTAIENDRPYVIAYIIASSGSGQYLMTSLREAVRQFKRRIIAHNFETHGWYMKGIAKNIDAHDVLEYLESL